MDNDQAAILWWRQLFVEMGSTANRRSPGPAGAAAIERTKALRGLFFKTSRLAPIHLLLEIGAHNAETSKRFMRGRPAARAIAYEASPDVYRRTLEAGLPAGIELVNRAIGGANTTVPFFVPEDQTMLHWSSLRKRMIHPVPVREVQVEMITLDQAGANAGGQGRDTALWIDVEGAGLEVLQSGTAFLSDRTAMVYMEVSDIETYEKGNTSIEIIKLLLSCGFVPVARDNQYRDAYNLMAVHSSTYLTFQELFLRWHYLTAPSNAGNKGSDALPSFPSHGSVDGTSGA